MAFTSAWRNFKRTQDLTVVSASLVYAAGTIFAFEVTPDARAAVFRWTLLWPAPWLVASFLIPMIAPPLKRGLARYVWISFQGGFGQTVRSIVMGVILLMAAGGFLYFRVMQSGLTGANVFAAFAAGIGILAAQAVLVRALEQVPEVRAQITEPDA
jgi:hypothetical protein